MWTLFLALVAFAQEAPESESPEPAPVAETAPESASQATAPPKKLKRGKLTQLPYAHTDFTAYTLEKGETRIGLMRISHGLTPSVQLSTAPLLDVIGAPNVGVKGWFHRRKRFDSALFSNLYYVPITKILNNVGAGQGLVQSGSSVTFDASLTFLQLGAKASARITQKWSAHLGASYARINTHGDLDLGRTAELEIPELGTVGGGKVRLAGDLIGEAALLSFATDFRFNRRDSLILQVNTPMYYGIRGQVDGGDYSEKQPWTDMKIGVGYGSWVPLQELGASSLSWQFSWKHIDLRLGVALSKDPVTAASAWMQAFNLTYRFGGSTRSTEREMRKEIKDERREFRRD